MKSPIVYQQSGTPLTVLATSEYQAWLDTQSEMVKNMLVARSFAGEGVALVHSADTGHLTAAVYFCKDPSDVWHAGDLAMQLPEGIFELTNDTNQQMLTAFGFVLGCYQLTGYKSVTSGQKAQLSIADKSLFDKLVDQTKAINLVRDLINTPAGDMMPQHLSQVMQDLADEFNAQFSEIIGDELLEQNFPTIHAVGRASANKPRLLDLRWGKPGAKKVTLVGKGVCFDSGGLDLKPAAGMRLMKKDMGGAAHVLGLAHLIMAAGLNIELRVLIPAVENAVSDDAFRPGDVIKTRQGITVEIDNTDAEGRLVLCDALTLASVENPDLIVDFATLTGACRIALGTELPGFFCDHSATVSGLLASAEQAQDPIWQMPLFKQYKDLLKSDVADMTNCASGPFGGAITAALYLQEFVNKDIPWVHFDVMAWNIRKLPGRPVGGEAFGVRAVFNYLEQAYGY